MHEKLSLCVLLLATLAAGCAHGVTPFDPVGDGGARASDAAAPDAKKPALDASTAPPTPPPPPSPDAGIQCQLSLTTGSPTCDQCVAQSCCAQENACSASTDCVAFLRCGNDCFADGGDPTPCLNGCAGAFPQGAQLFDALGACMQGSCGGACQ